MQNQKTHAKSGTLQIRRKNNGNGLQKKCFHGARYRNIWLTVQKRSRTGHFNTAVKPVILPETTANRLIVVLGRTDVGPM